MVDTGLVTSFGSQCYLEEKVESSVWYRVLQFDVGRPDSPLYITTYY